MVQCFLTSGDGEKCGVKDEQNFDLSALQPGSSPECPLLLS